MAVFLKSLRITAGLDASEYARGAQQKADAEQSAQREQIPHRLALLAHLKQKPRRNRS